MKATDGWGLEITLSEREKEVKLILDAASNYKEVTNINGVGTRRLVGTVPVYYVCDTGRTFWRVKDDEVHERDECHG